MIRIQVYLHKKQVQEIALLAKTQRKEKAKVIRALVQSVIEAQKDKKSIGKELLDLAELGKKLDFKDPKNLSIGHDNYLL